MIEFVITKNYDLIKQVVDSIRDIASQDPEVCSDPSADNTIWIAAIKGPDLLGYFKVSHITNRCLEVHPYLRREFHGTGIFTDVFHEFCKFVSEGSEYTNLVTYTPVVCKHIIKAAHRVGAKHVGTIPNGINWQGTVCDLLIYNKQIKEET